MTSPQTQNHALLMLGKVTPEAQTVSGKCKAGDARYNGRDERAVEEQHAEHLSELGLLVEHSEAHPPAQDEVQSTGPAEPLHEGLDQQAQRES